MLRLAAHGRSVGETTHLGQADPVSPEEITDRHPALIDAQRDTPAADTAPDQRGGDEDQVSDNGRPGGVPDPLWSV